MSEGHTSERLLVAVARGEADAFRQLYDQTAPKMFAITSRICQNPELAEKALVNTYTAVWRRAPAFDARKGSGMAWLSRIARNRALALQSQTPQDKTQGTGVYQTNELRLPDLVTARVDFPELDSLMGKLDGLDDRARQALLLAYYEGRHREELAQRVDMPVGAMTKHLRRGLNKLRATMGRAT